MTLDAKDYRNPCDVLQAKQEAALRKQKACACCTHRRRYEAFGEVVIACTIKRTAAKRICDLYDAEKK